MQSVTDGALRPTLIRGAAVFDGEQWLGQCDIGLEGSIVAEIGAAGKLTTAPDAVTFDASGTVLAPGFIDIHGMDRNSAAAAGKDAVNFLSQGVTTLVVGNCGVGAPKAAAMDVAINIVELAGHNAIREAGASDTTAVVSSLRSHLETGARGVSLGLMYEPGRSAPREELTAVARVVSEYNGVLAIHIRDEGPSFIASIQEVLTIRDQARTVVMHLKACGEDNWPELEHGRELLRKYGVAWTYYPYADTNTILAAAVPFPFESPSALAELLADPVRRAQFKDSGLQTLARRGWEGVVITQGPGDLVGQTIATVARQRQAEAEDVVASLLTEDAGIRVRFIEVADINSMHETARDPHAMPASDAYVYDSRSMNPEHPRSFGAIARSLYWAREEGYVSKYLRSVTSQPADLYSIPRGRIRVGTIADLALFELERVEDRASYDHPGTPAVGMRAVWVAGTLAYEGGSPTHAWAGTVLR